MWILKEGQEVSQRYICGDYGPAHGPILGFAKYLRNTTNTKLTNTYTN